ncbi:MAG TPA: phosphocholine cytidylyltransferase family protein [Candidatus Omnitrophota bacterium]|nr:phosphocholine cytidylyltransferase family protein [Candidatus Omnitrophota bacterium]
MNAVILAAGEGKRLRPFTDEKPKCLVPIGDTSIFDHQVDMMKRCGIRDIIAVKGYMAQKISRKDVKYYVNERYATTNMVMTLWCVQHEMKDESIVSYGDIIYNEDVLRKLMAAPHDISVVVDMNWERYWKRRFTDPLADAEALRFADKDRIKVIGQPAHAIADVQAGYIGLMKFKGRGIDTFKRSFLNAEKISQAGGKPWGCDRPFEKAFMTDMLQGIINEGEDIYGVKINGGWLEIDGLNDYELAKELFVDGKVVSVN